MLRNTKLLDLRLQMKEPLRKADSLNCNRQPLNLAVSHKVKRMLPLDLHVLGTPPAFILSQDQTLQKISFQKTNKKINVDVALLNF